MFNAYIHCKPDGTPFYVGKGSNDRWNYLSESWRNEYHKRIVKKYRKENILKGKLDCSTEEIAFDLERGLIKCLKRQGIKLANFTDGGEGMSGLSPSEETRRKLSLALKNKPKSIEHCLKVGIANKGKKLSQEHKQAVSKARLGTKYFAETRLKMSLASKGKPKSESHRLNILMAIKNQPKVICPHCNKSGAVRSMGRWHFNNCKQLPKKEKDEA